MGKTLPINPSWDPVLFHLLPVWPIPKLCFQEPKSPKSGTRYNFQKHISKRIPAFMTSFQIYRKITGQSYIVHLHYQFCAAENAVCRSHSIVHQSNHFTTVLQPSEFTQVSPFLCTVMKGHFSGYPLMNLWKCLFFSEDDLPGVQLADSAMLSLSHETFLQMVPCFWTGIALQKIVFKENRARGQLKWLQHGWSAIFIVHGKMD